MSSVKKEERLKRSIGARVCVDGVGDGVLRSENAPFTFAFCPSTNNVVPTVMGWLALDLTCSWTSCGYPRVPYAGGGVCVWLCPSCSGVGLGVVGVATVNRLVSSQTATVSPTRVGAGWMEMECAGARRLCVIVKVCRGYELCVEVRWGLCEYARLGQVKRESK